MRDGNDANHRFTIIHGDECDTFAATPRKGIVAAMTTSKGRKHTVLTEEELEAIPALQRSARDHIAAEGIYPTKWLLSAFSDCAGIEFICPLIDGHRRWWIGSVLQFAKTVMPDDTYAELEQLFRKILRGANCGFKIPDSDIGFVTDGLPFTPENDPDLRFGRWSDIESLVATDLLSSIAAQSPQFTAPPGPMGITPDDSEWHEWVHSNVTSLLQLSDLNYDVCNVLTFVQS